MTTDAPRSGWQGNVASTGAAAQRFVHCASRDWLRSLGASLELRASRARVPPEATQYANSIGPVGTYPRFGAAGAGARQSARRARARSRKVHRVPDRSLATASLASSRT
jgi:hypothetical protein